MAIRPTNPGPGPRSRKLSNILYTAEKIFEFPKVSLIPNNVRANQYGGQDRSFSLSVATLCSHCLKAIHKKRTLTETFDISIIGVLLPDHS